ncbi:hypothetical protein FBU59_006362 [Linderina macrospora]|uniref:Uncharacterized protein n=1 Tax=Linderina macrospora TaxID=4868 RepID=A0ACC1J049_9FUNG|nr:hypothetical protein FBU59_006362 [Linderina macrospora]
MDSFKPSTVSYQPHMRRRSSVSSNGSSAAADSLPSSPVSLTAPSLPVFERALGYTYVCEGCGFGTNLLSSYMPHISNPCGEPVKITWGKL